MYNMLSFIYEKCCSCVIRKGVVLNKNLHMF